jgi:hypothetical protein
MEVNGRSRGLAVSLALVGAACVAGAWVLYAVFRKWLLWSTVPMGIGGLCLAAAACLAGRTLAGFFTTRRGRVGANVAVMVVAAVALWGIANAISTRNYLLRDLTAARRFSIAPETLGVLRGLERSGERVRITTIASSGDIVFERVRDLLESYRARSDAVIVEHIDPDFDVAEIRLFLERFGDLPDVPGIAFESEGRKKSVSGEDLIETPRLPDGRPDPGVEPRFRGEQAITAALLSVTEERRHRVYFTRGHDEADLEGTDRYDYALWARELRLQNLDVLPLDLPTADRVPDDADVVVVARADPEIPFSQRELFLLERYLESGGKMLLLFEPLSPPQVAAGLVDPLSRWLVRYGARLPDGEIVVDPPASYRHPVVFQTNHFGDHEIVRDLAGSFMEFYFARPIEPVADNAHGFTPTPLVRTSPDGWTETDIGPDAIAEPAFDEDEDHRGPVCLALALEAPPATERTALRSRVVVVGDADIGTNEGLTARTNRTFLMNSVNWLVERETMISVPSTPFDERRLLTVGPAQRRAVFWLVVVGLPAVVLTLGGAVWTRRRR